MTTFLRRCYGDSVRLFNKAKNLPFLTATGLHFNKKKKIFIYIPLQADVKTYLIFDFHRLKNIVHGIVHCFITC